jgi:hypothetical protein
VSEAAAAATQLKKEWKQARAAGASDACSSCCCARAREQMQWQRCKVSADWQAAAAHTWQLCPLTKVPSAAGQDLTAVSGTNSKLLPCGIAMHTVRTVDRT